MYFRNQSAVSFTALVPLDTSGPLATVNPPAPSGPPLRHPGPPVWAIILALVLGGVCVVSVGVAVLACVTKRTINKGYAQMNALSAQEA